MDRAYYHLIEKASDLVAMATAIAKNANYKDTINIVTQPRLQKLCQSLENSRRELQDVLGLQMKSY